MATRTKAPPLTAAQARAVAAFLQTWETVWGDRGGKVGYIVRLSRPQIARLAEGDTSMSSTLIARVVRQAAAWAAAEDHQYFTHSRPLTDGECTRLLKAVDALGAQYGELFDSEYQCRRAEYQARQPAPAPQRPSGDFAVALGVSIAPFLSSDGEPVVLALNHGSGRLMMMAAVDDAHGWSYYTAADGGVVRDTFQSGSSLRASIAHFNTLLGEGVHAAPWRPHDHPHGGAWVVVDRDHQLVAIMDYADESTAASARRDAEAVLDMARLRYQSGEPLPEAKTGGWRDPYDDGYDDPDWCGEGWKH